MRNSILLLSLGGLVAVLVSGCTGAERKLGRGILNLSEFTRLGEIQRSVEQTAIWDNPEKAYTSGLIRGINRSVARTAVGLYEIATFPFASYDPIFLPEYPVYPDSYRPKLLSDQTFAMDGSLGFSGGDVFPFFPGSRFRVFDY